MRLIALALVAMLAAGCGGDDPDQAQDSPRTRQPAPRRPAPDTVPTDTTLGDTTRLAADTADSGPGTASRTGGAEPGGADARTGETAARPGARAGAEADEAERLYTVQVAAFTDSESAAEWAGRLRTQGLPVWTSLTETGGQTFYRVRVGASPSFSEARQLGSMLRDRYEWPVWVAPLAPADRLPEDAVEDTRRVLRGG